MNRFRTKKRAKDDSATGRTSQESEHSSVFGFRKKKNQPEEAKQEIDLATALPPTDDFRTSLLMTNLSARFSMLREQDDPNTKIGKASDDSVLFSNRQSRLADFGFAPTAGGLSDIAEVESIKAPRFPNTDSYASDDDYSQGGSIMNRSKPLEGNNLFGGRQKIYKIPVGKTGGGGLVGRALYDDDVAVSSFQRWRKAERERRSLDGEDLDDQAEDDTELSGYNRKRETSSTTSSASFARNSTAATSITSQQTWMTKDSTAPPSTASTPALERTVTRTRRLYEQATQETQELASPGLSKIDTFNRQKAFGSRTPEIGGNSPSPTTNGFAERLFAERRAALTKTSAPNLKAVTPPLSATSENAAESAAKPPARAAEKLGGLPPLSPPLSEEEDQPKSMLPIQPNDLGKATAMGVFQKPSQPYDESKYAQRQIQLQQGRETPIGRSRAESNASFATCRSRSNSSAHRQLFEPKSELLKTQPSVEEEPIALSQPSLEPISLALAPPAPAGPPPAVPRASMERPSDKDHPMFRRSPMPSPLAATAKPNSVEVSPISEKPCISLDVSQENSAQVSPDHSPTLGSNPNTGLSGMVRQHLRSESNASSIYGPTPPASGFEPQFPIEHDSTPDLPAPKSNPWLSPGQEWTASFYGNISEPSLRTDRVDVAEPARSPVAELKDSSRSSRTSRITEEETDEFASQLADARRRVREKLTSYVESDSSRAASPLSHSESSKDLAAPNPLGLGTLKSKSSRGSLIDRSRNLVSGQNKTKLLGIGASTMSTSPSPSKQNFEERESPPLETMAEETPRETFLEGPPVLPEIPRDTINASPEEQEEAKAHPGLRAFRQARRELQRNKELEMLARRQAENPQSAADGPSAAPSRPSYDHAPRQRTPSRERRAPPVSYRQRPSEDNQPYQPSNTSSPTASRPSGERGRSDSDTSGRSSSRPRPPRLRGNMGHYDDQVGPSNPPRQQGLHAPGLPGTDIRRSPIMPPQHSVRGALSPAPSPHMLHNSKSASNLSAHGNRPAYEPNYGMPSPISPSGLPPPSPYALGPGASPVGTPTSFGPRSRQNSAAQSPAFGPVNGAPRRGVDKRDISEPTFMTTSRVPTVNLPQDGASMGNGQYGGQRYPGDGNNGSSAPPLPPINPRRKRENSRPRPYEDSGLAAPRLPFASQGNGSTSSLDYADDDRSVYDSEGEDNKPVVPRQRLPTGRMAQFEGGAAPRGPSRRENSPPFIPKGPPASRTVLTSNIKVHPNMGVPGGMF